MAFDGGRPALGRFLGTAGDPEIVLSDSLWRRRFAGDPGAVGRQVRVNGELMTIVGVAPPGFTFPQELRLSLGAAPELPQLWAPFERAAWATNRHMWTGELVVRLPPGRTMARFVSQVETIGRAFGRDHPDWSEYREAVVTPLEGELTATTRPVLQLLLGAVACVLLVACLNVANLLLARQTSRARDIALRVSLGAPRSRLVAHGLAEVLLLAPLGGALGVAFAYSAVAALRWLEPAELPRLDAIRIDPPILAFAAGITVLAAVIAAAAPVWRSTSAARDVVAGIEMRSQGVGKRGRRVRSTLVVVELAASLILLVGASVLARSFERLLTTDMGAIADHVVTVDVNVAMGRVLPLPRQAQLAAELVAAVRGLPGVKAAAAANGLPPNRTRMMTMFYMADPKTGERVEYRMGLLNPTPEYFSALGIALLRGRGFSSADGPDAARVAILSAGAAKRLFGTIEAVGRMMPLGGRSEPVTVVGVVRDVKYSGLDQEAEDRVYVPFAQQPFRNMTLVARTTGDPRELSRHLAGVVHGVDRQVTVGPARTLEEVVSEAVARPRFRTALFGTLAGLAVLLAVLGLYAVSAYSVALRTVEIGVRMALGADRWRMTAMIVGDGLRLAALGAALGLVGAFFLARTLSGFVYGVTTHDATSYVVASVGQVFVAGVASLVAARRAAMVEPTVALRAE